tara:strand:+ start:495 stop:689 length:195 start_codon:yes stop_codon:yes gene_type:complete
MSNEITPTDSVCPIFLEPQDPAQIEADLAEAKTKAKADKAREKAKADVIAKLGLTADEVAALLS